MNPFDDAISVGKHVMIPKSQDRKALRLQPLLADSVALTVRVLAAIYLNDQPRIEADEVDNVCPEWFLSPERRAI
jgi:hypothetical protein